MDNLISMRASVWILIGVLTLVTVAAATAYRLLNERLLRQRALLTRAPRKAPRAEPRVEAPTQEEPDLNDRVARPHQRLQRARLGPRRPVESIRFRAGNRPLATITDSAPQDLREINASFDLLQTLATVARAEESEDRSEDEKRRRNGFGGEAFATGGGFGGSEAQTDGAFGGDSYESPKDSSLEPVAGVTDSGISSSD